MQEKEQLLKELRNANSAKEAEVVKCRIRQLEHDLQQHAIDYNSQQFDADKCVSCCIYFSSLMLIYVDCMFRA